MTDVERPIRLRLDDITWTSTGDEVVVLDLRTSKYLQLNDSAAVLWILLTTGATQADLAAELTTRFSLTPGQANDDAAEFLADLAARDLLAS